MRAAVLLMVSVASILAISGCGDDSSPDATDPSSSSGAVLPGGGLTITEAIATDADPPLAVRGWVVGSGGDARLCSGYNAGADEPCVEPSLALEGSGLEANGTQASLLGAVEDETFVVSSTVQG